MAYPRLPLLTAAAVELAIGIITIRVVSLFFVEYMLDWPLQSYALYRACKSRHNLGLRP